VIYTLIRKKEKEANEKPNTPKEYWNDVTEDDDDHEDEVAHYQNLDEDGNVIEVSPKSIHHQTTRHPQKLGIAPKSFNFQSPN